MQERSDLRQKLQQTVASLNARIDSAQASMTKGADAAGEKTEENVQKLKEMRDDLSAKLAELDTTKDDQWENFKSKANQTLNDIGDRIKDIKI